jgi:hypothetical protein
VNEGGYAGEIRVNIGGDPGRDDYGLPPVDVQIPDDARELDRDVQAYYRELKALRRRRLARRLFSPLARDGMVLPVLAGCLALTLLAGTLLTVFTAGQEPAVSGAGLGNMQGQASTGQTHRAPSPATQSPSLDRLPDVPVRVGDRDQSLLTLAGAVLVLALVPPNCQCVPHLRQLKGQADKAQVQMYLVGGKGAGVGTLVRRVGLAAAHAVTDPADALPHLYRPGTLTAVLVRPDSSVADMVPDNGHGFQLLGELQTLERGHQAPVHKTSAGAVGPAGTTPAGTTPAGATPAGTNGPAGAASHPDVVTAAVRDLSPVLSIVR